MSEVILKATINREKKTAIFSGPGTFAAKETIKQLGNARWLREQKAWEVQSFSLSSKELLEHIPEVSIEEISSEIDESESKEDLKESNVPRPLPKGLSVTAFISRARAILQQSFPQTFHVYGVLSSVKQYQSRIYIDLAEIDKPDEKVSCVIWQDAEKILAGLKKAGFSLEKDLQVMFEVSINVSPKDGRISLSVLGIVAEYTIAKLAAQREITNQKLKDEGIFSKNKQQSLPFLPRRLGIMTSSGGTVINDFKASLDVAQFGFELFWVQVSVQGREASHKIVQGIEYLSRFENLDAILIFRGGGSQADLAVFNEFQIAKAICLCQLPVLSAIGHQEDMSSVQDVSFQAFGVPKDLGRFFADIVINYRKQFEENTKLIQTLSAHQVTEKELSIKGLIPKIYLLGTQIVENKINLTFNIGQRVVDRAARCVERSNERLLFFREILLRSKQLLEKKKLILNSHKTHIEGASPTVQLARGFTIVRNTTDEFITSKDQIKNKSIIEIEFKDGKKRVEIS